MVLETGTLGCQWMRTRSKRFLYIRSNRTDHCDLGRGERKRLYVYTIMCKLRDESICKSVQRCVVNLSGLLTRAETQFASKMFPSQSRVIMYYQSLWGWWYVYNAVALFSMVTSRKSTEEPMTLRRTRQPDRRGNSKARLDSRRVYPH